MDDKNIKSDTLTEEFLKSSYYYQEAAMKRPDMRCRVGRLFHENKQCYGYRRICGLLKRENITVSEKVIRQIIWEKGLIVSSKQRWRYSSYQGKISPSVPNKIERDFHTDKPNQKWLTDIINGSDFCKSGLPPRRAHDTEPQVMYRGAPFGITHIAYFKPQIYNLLTWFLPSFADFLCQTSACL